MAFILFGFVILSNLFCVLLNYKCKYVSIISMCILAVLMAWSSTDGGDMLYYHTEYNGLLQYKSGFEIGYKLLGVIARLLGFNFNLFRLLVFLVGSLFLYFGIRTYTDNFNFIILGYSLTLFLFFSITIRYYLAFSVIIFATQFLSKRKPVSYLLLCILAVSFHTAAFFAVFFVVTAFGKEALKVTKRILYFIDALMVLYIFVLIVFPDIWMVFAKIFKCLAWFSTPKFSYMVNNYLSHGYSRINCIFVLAFIASYIWFISSKNKLISSENKLVDVGEKGIRSYTEIIDIQFLVTGAILPALMMVVSAIRLLFIPLFLSFPIVSVIAGDAKKYPSVVMHRIAINRFYYKGVSIVIMVLWFSVIYLRHTLAYDIVNFLSTNILLSN